MDGTVLVSVVDAKTDKVMWQGQAADVVDLPVARPERAEAQIGHAVAEIFKKFPPQTIAVLTRPCGTGRHCMRHRPSGACRQISRRSALEVITELPVALVGKDCECSSSRNGFLRSPTGRSACPA
jgi:uncharacterized protein DUF4136